MHPGNACEKRWLVGPGMFVYILRGWMLWSIFKGNGGHAICIAMCV